MDLSSYDGRHFAEDGMVEDMQKKRGVVLISTELVHDVFYLNVCQYEHLL